jgi:hypothetical protein
VGIPRQKSGRQGQQGAPRFSFRLFTKGWLPEAFINEFGASLSSVASFSGGGKRPSIPISALSSGDSTRIIETMFSFAAKAAQK